MSKNTPNLGPIRPQHEGNGWKLRGNEKGRWWLLKDFGRYIGIISATTPTTCAWQITTRAGDLLREASSDDVAVARAAADKWVAKNPE